MKNNDSMGLMDLWSVCRNCLCIFCYYLVLFFYVLYELLVYFLLSILCTVTHNEIMLDLV
jgi:hypothetical protein